MTSARSDEGELDKVETFRDGANGEYGTNSQATDTQLARDWQLSRNWYATNI